MLLRVRKVIRPTAPLELREGCGQNAGLQSSAHTSDGTKGTHGRRLFCGQQLEAEAEASTTHLYRKVAVVYVKWALMLLQLHCFFAWSRKLFNAPACDLSSCARDRLMWNGLQPAYGRFRGRRVAK